MKFKQVLEEEVVKNPVGFWMTVTVLSVTSLALYFAPVKTDSLPLIPDGKYMVINKSVLVPNQLSWTGHETRAQKIGDNWIYTLVRHTYQISAPRNETSYVVALRLKGVDADGSDHFIFLSAEKWRYVCAGDGVEVMFPTFDVLARKACDDYGELPN